MVPAGIGSVMHVHANAAVSVDGKLATRRREQVAISGPSDFERVDRLRAEMDAVMVGVGTVLADDPSLTVPQEFATDGQPARVVLDSTGRTPADARVLSSAAPTYIVVGGDAAVADIERLEASGATVLETTAGGRVDVNEGLGRLEAEGIERLLVEGGGEVLYSLFETAAVDVVTLYVSPSIIGGRDAPTLVDGDGFVERFPELELDAIERIDDGVLCSYSVSGWQSTPAG